MMNQTDPDPEPAHARGRVRAATRLLLAGSLVAVFAFLAVSARASEPWRMNAFSTAIAVGDDGALVIREDIDAEFLEPRHGIYRYVPYKGATTDGEKYRLDIRLIGIEDGSGVPQPVKESRSRGNVVWRIGDADHTLTGSKTYHITYEVRGAILRLDDRDELFWNVAGEGWDVPLPNLKVSVEFPELTEDEIHIRCFTGSYGSVSEDCFSIKAPSFAGFTTNTTGDPMTVSVSWPKGHIGTESLAVRLVRLFSRYWHFSLPLFTLALYWAAWRRFGDDDTGLAITPEYDAPKGLRPAQLKALLKQRASAEDLAPTLIDLAVRGHLTIEETEEKVRFGRRKDYLLKRTEKDASTLEAYEKDLLENLFSGAREKKVSALENVFYKHIPEFTRAVMNSLVGRKLFEARPDKVRVKWILPGILALFVLIASLLVFGKNNLLEGGFPFIFSVFVSFLLVIGFGWAMPKWTREGAAAVRHGKGFKIFISKVKKYRTAWEEKENMFETVLPYALAFGLGKKWARAFEGLHREPPTWYVGAAGGAWNPSAFESSLSSMTKSFTTAIGSSPSSSGGSGGFSGGGFGGGGGGSW